MYLVDFDNALWHCTTGAHVRVNFATQTLQQYVDGSELQTKVKRPLLLFFSISQNDENQWKSNTCGKNVVQLSGYCNHYAHSNTKLRNQITN